MRSLGLPLVSTSQGVVLRTLRYIAARYWLASYSPAISSNKLFDNMISALTSIVPSGYAILILVPVCVLFYVVVFNNLKAGLSEIPGPFLARHTDAWRLYIAWRYAGHEKEVYGSLKEQYGDVIRIGPRAVTVLDPRAVPIIYGVKSRLAKV